jgi:RNA-splicing ligase RtcB
MPMGCPPRRYVRKRAGRYGENVKSSGEGNPCGKDVRGIQGHFELVDAAHAAGISRKVARLRTMGVVKG